MSETSGADIPNGVPWTTPLEDSSGLPISPTPAEDAIERTNYPDALNSEVLTLEGLKKAAGIAKISAGWLPAPMPNA